MPHLTGPGTQNQPWWDADRDAYLRAHYRQQTAAAIGATLGCSMGAVHIRAKKIGLATPLIRRYTWTPERLALLRRLYGALPNADLAIRLGCSRQSVRQKAYQIGLHAIRNRATSLLSAEQRAERIAVLLAWKLSLISGADASAATGIPTDGLATAAMRAAVWGTRQTRRQEDVT